MTIVSSAASGGARAFQSCYEKREWSDAVYISLYEAGGYSIEQLNAIKRKKRKKDHGKKEEAGEEE